MATSRFDSRLAAIEAPKPGYVELVFALAFVWGFGDAVSTLIALSFTGQLAMEANPLARALLAQGPFHLIVMKGGVAIVAGVTLLACREVVESVPHWRTWLLSVTLLGTFIVVSNVYVGFAAVL